MVEESLMRLAAGFGAFLAFGAVAFGADPQLMNLVMPDAKVLAGMNVVSAKNSPLGQFLILRLPAGNQQLNDLKAATGFDPLQDVTEILAASTADPAKPGGLVIMKGTFDSGKIIAVLGSAQKGPSYQVQTYAGATLVTITGGKGKVPPAFAFIGGTIAMAGDAPTVTAALDRSAGLNAIDSALAVQVRALSGQDAWVVSTVSPSSFIPAPAAGAAATTNQVNQFLSNVQGFSGSVKFGPSIPVTLDVVANSPQNAEALGNVVKLLLSMMTPNGSQANAGNPQMAAAMQLLQTLQVKTSGSTVDLALTIPEAQVEALILSMPKPKAN
jgi:hypothetical protein